MSANNILSTENEAINQAKSFIDQNNFIDAEDIYRGLIERGCIDARVYCNLGLLRGMAGAHKEQRELLEQAIQLNPEFPEAHLNLGNYYLRAGRAHQSISSFQEVIRLLPNMAEAHNNLGVAFSNSNEFDQAKAALDRAISLQPEYAAGWLNRCRLNIMRGNQDMAESDYAQAIRLNPGCPSLPRVIAEALHCNGQIEKAVAQYQELLKEDASDTELLKKYAECLRILGRSDEAVEQYLYLISIDANNADVFADYAMALSDLGLVPDALAILDQALEIQPDNIFAINFQGVLLQDLGRTGEAISRFELAHSILPQHPGVLANLAIAHRYQGQLDEAISCFKKAIAAEPTRCDLYQGLLFTYSIGGAELARPMLEAADQYWKLVRRNQTKVQSQEWLQPPGNSGSRLKIGFLCAEVGEHVVSAFLTAFLRHYDRDRFEVELISVCRHYSERALMMVNMVEHAFSLQGLSLEAGRCEIRKRGYDIIVETSGFTRSTGIEYLAERCAPVQCHYIGYHASTGLDTMDYFIGDEETVPEEFADQFREKLWRLPRPWLAFDPFVPFPKAESLATKTIPALGSFNQFSKIREDTLRCWAEALKQTPNSILVLKDRLTADAFVCDRIKNYLERKGVNPKRIHFLEQTFSWEQHLQHYNIIDVALDTTPWSSATTAVDAMAMGVPLVAIRGQCTSARMSTSLVKGLGHPDWVSNTPEEFGAIVANLCTDLLAHRHAKFERQQQMLSSPLMDQHDLAEALGDAFASMSKRASLSNA